MTERPATSLGETIQSALKKLPGVRRVLQTSTFKQLRYEAVLLIQERRNFLFTQFLRVPTQFDALVGPVIDFLVRGKSDASLKISVWGCSNGAEPYSIASVLICRRPELDFTIRAFDIDEQMLDKARTGTYAQTEVLRNPTVSAVFIEETFSHSGDLYQVKPAVRDRVSFEAMSVLHKDLANKAGKADIIFAQNFLFHFRPKTARLAFENICRLMQSRAALFVDGMDLGLRRKLTRTHGLEPLDYRIEEIHNEARRERGTAWPYEYWGLEPFSKSKRDWKRRYSTIFLRERGPA